MAALVAVALALAVVGAACSSEDEDSITVYSGRGEEFVAPVIEAFEEETGVDV
jgi:iron(III) transport system substrate-binding protein